MKPWGYSQKVVCECDHERMQFVLVHSPFVGPATWAPVAEGLRDAGHSVAVPVLTGVPSDWRAVVRECVSALPGGEIVLVGHSGAGSILPSIGDKADVHTYLFVDATLPPRSGVLPVEDGWVRHLRKLARDGVLPPWSEIMGPEVMSALLPDPDVRRVVEEELPRLPMSYFEEPVTVPDDWDARPVAYLQLSPLYATQADEARSRGYAVDVLHGGHLHMLVDPSSVAERMLRLVLSSQP